jgi:hypothetical protein
MGCQFSGPEETVICLFNPDGLVKSPSAALRFNFVAAAHV